MRLMTIHGSKGLEFPVTHLPGLNADTIPRTGSAPSCPPPDGMVEGGEGSALNVLRAGAEEEQECLFYVALSRARDRLFLYAPTQKSNRHARPTSRFVDILGASVDHRIFVPSKEPLPPTETQRIELEIEGGLRFRASQIALYERCPRRFFYTHVLQLGGRRTATAFMQLHEAVQMVVDGLIAEPETISDDELDRRVTTAMADSGLSEHGYREQFRALALSLLRFFISSRDGRRAEAPVAISVRFGDEEILVRPGRRARGSWRSSDAEESSNGPWGLEGCRRRCCRSFRSRRQAGVPRRGGRVRALGGRGSARSSADADQARESAEEADRFSRADSTGPLPRLGIADDVSWLPEFLHLRSDPRRGTAQKVRLTVTGSAESRRLIV